MPAVAVDIPVSYFQYDQQGVVFNMWYFGWFDDAMTQFTSEIGYPYTEMNADGIDVQLVHTEADWRRRGALRRAGDHRRLYRTGGLDQLHPVLLRPGGRRGALDRPDRLRGREHGRLG